MGEGVITHRGTSVEGVGLYLGCTFFFFLAAEWVAALDSVYSHVCPRLLKAVRLCVFLKRLLNVLF